MDSVGSRLDDHVHRAAAGASITGVIGAGHDVDFLQGADVGRNLPRSLPLRLIGSLNGDVTSVELELLISLHAAAEGIVIRVIPAARTRVTAGTELGLKELGAWRGSDEHVNLASIERAVFDFLRANDVVVGAGGALEQRGRGGDLDLLR